jgi:glycosyltransferase involved in cell wall biosynthesis
MPGISIIVCTHNRPESLARMWDSVDSQTRLPSEMIIVDSSDNSRTQELGVLFR